MIGYMPFVGIVPAIILAVTEPRENSFVRFHARQAATAHILFWMVSIAFTLMRAALPWPVGLLLLLPQLLFFVATVGGLIFLMIKAFRWKTVKIPVIGDQVQ